MMTLWLAGAPLVLASRSAVRHALLCDAGVPADIVPADVDERAIEQQAMLSDPGKVAVLLARAKAAAIAAGRPDRLVLGADQTLALGERRFSKPGDRGAARAQLRAMRGRVHELHTAVAVMRGEALLFETREVARLTMRNFSDDFLEVYLDIMGEAVLSSVGAYQLEKSGIQLFEQIDGDHFVILGLPLLALLRCFREQGWLAT